MQLVSYGMLPVCHCFLGAVSLKAGIGQVPDQSLGPMGKLVRICAIVTRSTMTDTTARRARCAIGKRRFAYVTSAHEGSYAAFPTICVYRGRSRTMLTCKEAGCAWRA